MKIHKPIGRQVTKPLAMTQANLVRQQCSLDRRGWHSDLEADLGQGQPLSVELARSIRERFIHPWYRAAEGLSGSIDDPVDRVIADAQLGSDVFDQRSSTVASQHLVGSPLAQLMTRHDRRPDAGCVGADGCADRIDAGSSAEPAGRVREYGQGTPDLGR